MPEIRYIRQLDSLRAIAVILVIIHHWVPAGNVLNVTPNGQIGVNIFFVLSGFLITKILLDNRLRAEAQEQPSSVLVKNFYLRRALRIFPIYYLAIFTLLILHNYTGTNIKSSLLYFLTYTSNFYFVKIHAWDGMLSHLWSLAVEEQFYLVWPWIILFINKKYLLHIIGCFILTGVITQYYFSELLTFTCFDAFGLGALLAWQLTFRPAAGRKFHSALSVLAVIAMIFFTWGLVQQRWVLPLRTDISLVAVWLISYIVLKRDNTRFKWLLNNRAMIYTGRISYGIYLYHNMIPTFNWELIEKYYNPMTHDFLLKDYWLQLFWIGNGIMVLLTACLSYELIEKPFLRLKKYFEYRREGNVNGLAAELAVAEGER